MSIRVFIDVETIPSQQPGIREEIAAGIRPPANYKKPDTIGEWLAANREQEADRLYRQTALDGSQGEIVAVGLAIEDEPVSVFWRTLAQPERDPIEQALAFVRRELAVYDCTPSQARWVGWNVQWDLRFLYQRCVILGVKPTVQLHHDARPGSDHVLDLMTAWAGWGNRCSLGAACKAIGVRSPKEDGDGSRVWDLVQASRYDQVIKYNRGDVEAARHLHRRMLFLEEDAA